MSIGEWLLALLSFGWVSKHKKRQREKELEELKIQKMQEELKLLKKKNEPITKETDTSTDKKDKTIWH